MEHQHERVIITRNGHAHPSSSVQTTLLSLRNNPLSDPEALADIREGDAYTSEMTWSVALRPSAA